MVMALGEYWAEVTLSYALAVLLLGFVTGLSLYQARRTHKKLDELECAPDER